MSVTKNKIIVHEGKNFSPIIPPLKSIGGEIIRFSAERSPSPETPLEIIGREAISDSALVLASYQGGATKFAVEIAYLHNPSAIITALNQL